MRTESSIKRIPAIRARVGNRDQKIRKPETAMTVNQISAMAEPLFVRTGPTGM